ncbi:MAG: MFS transporter [Micrococcales bacterium]
MAKRSKPAKVALGPAFNRLWSSTLSSHIADGVLATAAPLLAATLTHDPILIAGLSALVMLPWLLFGIPIGGLLDRVDRRLALAAASAAKLIAAAAVSLAIATGSMNIWVLYIAAFVIGTSEVFSDTAAQAMIPKLLNSDQLERGNSKLSVAQTVLQNFVGAPLGGVLYATAIWIPFAVNSAGFAVAAALILFIPAKVRSDWERATAAEDHKDRGRFWEDIRFGIAYLYNDKPLLRLVVTTASVGFFFSAATSTQVLYLLKIQQVPEALFGVVMTIAGVAGLFGALHTPWWSAKLGRGGALAWSIAIGPLGIFLAGWAPNIGVYLAFFMVHMYAISLWNILLMSTYHSLIPNHLFGRIHGTRRTLVWGMMPLGSMLGGWLATFGLSVPLILGGGAATLVALTGVRFIAKLGNESSGVFEGEGADD